MSWPYHDNLKAFQQYKYELYENTPLGSLAAATVRIGMRPHHEAVVPAMCGYNMNVRANINEIIYLPWSDGSYSGPNGTKTQF